MFRAWRVDEEDMLALEDEEDDGEEGASNEFLNSEQLQGLEYA